ncbi:threonyl-tRNA synthetase editing domain-containing protein [Nocardia sp. NPDC058058]|uniref:threonyl-tRNA synthetase editing domain-containing protein n=1 Tax=Nocardia sp. NPDC058058 TaxID=3346317 RepID=UPI0036DF49B0
MLIQSSRCRTFEYAVTEPSACAVGVAESELGKPHRFTECLVVSIALEHGDLVLGAAAAKIIRRLGARTKATSVVIDGYLRLPTHRERSSPRIDLLTDLADSLDLLAEVTERLTHSGENVHMLPFGWHSKAQAEVTEGPHAQHSLRLHAGDLGAGGGVVAALDVPAMQRFRLEKAPTFSPTCA